MSKRLIILCAGGYGQTVADVAEQTGKYDEIAFLDDNSDKAIDTCNNFVNYISDDTDFYPAFGNNEGRVGWLYRLMEMGCNIPTIIHPTAYVSPKTTIIAGTTVLPGAIVKEGVHVCLGAIVKGENHLPRCMKVEAGTVINNREYQEKLPVKYERGAYGGKQNALRFQMEK